MRVECNDFFTEMIQIKINKTIRLIKMFTNMFGIEAANVRVGEGQKNIVKKCLNYSHTKH